MTPICSRIEHISERISWSESTGGTGKYPPLIAGRCPLFPFGYDSPVFHAASSEKILTREPDISTDHSTASKTKNSGSGPKYAVSPSPVDLRYSAPRFAIERGSRS